jgi:type III pantothenate kinase
MLLAVDIGNTNIHVGLWNGTVWVQSWRARTIAEKMADEYAVLLRNFFAERELGFDDVTGVVMASVVPPLTPTFLELCEQRMGCTPLNVEPGVRTGIRVLVDNPSEVGPDRVVNSAAVQKLYGGPAIVIDLGTATTFDIINADGDYIGGVIATGILLAHDALVSRAARLRKVELTAPPTVIGRNTVHAMQSGLFLGYIAMIEGLVARIKHELNAPGTKVIATGGLSALFTQHTDVIDEIAPNLTLDGLRIIWEMNQGKG